MVLEYNFATRLHSSLSYFIRLYANCSAGVSTCSRFKTEVQDGETVEIRHIRLVVIARMAEGVGKVGRYSNVGILVKDGTAQKILQLGAVLGMGIEETMHLATLCLVEIALAIVEEIFFVIVNRYHTASSIFAE